MHWFRSRSKFGSWLALAALAVQLALSFGHVHIQANAPVGSGAPAAIQTMADADSGGGASHRHHPALTDELCAICALIHLAGAAQTATPPAVAAPVAYRRIVSEIVAELGTAPPRRAPFAARAPPVT